MAKGHCVVYTTEAARDELNRIKGKTGVEGKEILHRLVFGYGEQAAAEVTALKETAAAQMAAPGEVVTAAT